MSGYRAKGNLYRGVLNRLYGRPRAPGGFLGHFGRQHRHHPSAGCSGATRGCAEGRAPTARLRAHTAVASSPRTRAVCTHFWRQHGSPCLLRAQHCRVHTPPCLVLAQQRCVHFPPSFVHTVPSLVHTAPSLVQVLLDRVDVLLRLVFTPLSRVSTSPSGVQGPHGVVTPLRHHLTGSTCRVTEPRGHEAELPCRVKASLCLLHASRGRVSHPLRHMQTLLSAG